MLIERGDVDVFDEPFSARYYFSDERRSRRFDERLPDSDLGSIIERLRAAAEDRPVCFKDMAYHVAGAIDDDVLSGFEHTFLIREPRAALASLGRMWPDYSDEEGGFDRLGELYDLAARLSRRAPVVLDADEMSADPAAYVRSWCDAVGLPYLAAALTWEPGMQPQWELWRDWYEGVAETTGFTPPRSTPPADVAPGRAALVERSESIYRRVAEVRLRP